MEEKKKKTLKKTPKKKVPAKKVVKKENPNAKWYVLNIRTGYENSIQKELRQRAEATGMEDRIVELLVPVQKKIFVKKGKQEVKEEKIFPGYILIKMELDNRSWDLVQNTEGVRGFVKTDRYPKPLAESEVQAITKFMEVEQPSFQTSFSDCLYF